MKYSSYMYKNDARKLTKGSQQLIRNQAINLSTVYKWAKLYKDFGKKGLILKKRGVKMDTNSKLTPNQVKTIIKILTNKTPDELDMLFLFWTRRAVQLLIQNLWKILILIRTIGDYLKRIGFTPQRPLRRAYEQNFKAVQVYGLNMNIHSSKKKQINKKTRYTGLMKLEYVLIIITAEAMPLRGKLQQSALMSDESS